MKKKLWSIAKECPKNCCFCGVLAISKLDKFQSYQHPVFQKEILIQRGIWKKACKSFHAKNHQIS
jgi:hypothetical protein